MARLKNISGVDVHVGRADGPLVEAESAIAVDGDVIADLDDAYVTGAPDDILLDPETKERAGFTGGARAWPKTTWELIPEVQGGKKKEGE